jgi:hypothetical protein
MAKRAIKKRLTQQQEFEIMKLVLNKFLWVGTAIMMYGLYFLFQHGFLELKKALSLIVVGAIVFVLFLIIVVKEYEIVR